MAAIQERVEVAKGADAGSEGAVPESYWNDVATGPLSDAEIAEYTRLATERSMSILDLAPDGDRWKYVKEKDGCKIYQCSEEGSPINLMKGITNGPCDFERLKKNVKGETTTPLLREMFAAVDPMNIDSRVLHRVRVPDDRDNTNGPSIIIPWGSFRTPPILWNRDFVWLQFADSVEDPATGKEVFLVSSTSIEREDAPNMEGTAQKYVRGAITSTGYVFRPAPTESEPKNIEMTYVVRVDPAGWVPTWVINLVAADQALNAARARDRAALMDGVSDVLAKTSLPGIGDMLARANAVKLVTVGARSAADVAVAVPNANSVVRFSFWSPDGSCGFQIVSGDGDGDDEGRAGGGGGGDGRAAEGANFLALQRYEMEEGVGGVVPVAQGTCTFHFDNTFSWLKSKRVGFSFEVLDATAVNAGASKNIKVKKKGKKKKKKKKKKGKN